MLNDCVLERGAAKDAIDSYDDFVNKRIFDMFVSSRPGGTGLGLFLARTAIERCGGTIVAVDKDAPGAQIQIRLPLSESDEKDTDR